MIVYLFLLHKVNVTTNTATGNGLNSDKLKVAATDSCSGGNYRVKCTTE
jgi:hypothetical protein